MQASGKHNTDCVMCAAGLHAWMSHVRRPSMPHSLSLPLSPTRTLLKRPWSIQFCFMRLALSQEALLTDLATAMGSQCSILQLPGRLMLRIFSRRYFCDNSMMLEYKNNNSKVLVYACIHNVYMHTNYSQCIHIHKQINVFAYVYVCIYTVCM
jgi:hypothetical protein